MRTPANASEENGNDFRLLARQPRRCWLAVLFDLRPTAAGAILAAERARRGFGLRRETASRSNRRWRATYLWLRSGSPLVFATSGFIFPREFQHQQKPRHRQPLHDDCKHDNSEGCDQDFVMERERRRKRKSQRQCQRPS